MRTDPDTIIAYLWADGEWISEDSVDYGGFPHDKSDDYITVTWGTPISDIANWVGEVQAILFLREALGHE